MEPESQSSSPQSLFDGLLTRLLCFILLGDEDADEDPRGDTRAAAVGVDLPELEPTLPPLNPVLPLLLLFLLMLLELLKSSKPPQSFPPLLLFDCVFTVIFELLPYPPSYELPWKFPAKLSCHVAAFQTAGWKAQK